MKISSLHIWGIYLGLFILLQSCSSISYFKKNDLQGVNTMDEHTYFLNTAGDSILLKEQYFEFTKNGRVEYSYTLNADQDTIQTTEKKLFFDKQTFPDLPNYYCKTRWKTNQRERISCYSQKKHKQNEKIVHYSKTGKILKSVDHFKTFNTHYYNYKNGDLQSIVIKDKSDKVLDSIFTKCLKTDVKNNCIIKEQRHTLTDSLKRIYRTISY
ncbi:hypothetical protein ACJOV8_015170 [Formosa sp. 3Alg 14/1]|uniref:hypothetical protein n=1 Tax=Formosa sp. 3Alg 14/1 TaxID=3382190 RepID=UPI0039BE5ECC